MGRVKTFNLVPKLGRNQKWTEAEATFYVKATVDLKKKYPERTIADIARGLGVTYGSLNRWINIRGGLKHLIETKEAS